MVSSGYQSNESITELLNNVSEYDIMKHYLGIVNIPCVINSPLRKDNNPSLGIYSHTGTRIHYMDFGTKDSGSIIDLLSNMWGKSLNDTILQIYKDLPKFKSIHSKFNVSYSNKKIAISDSKLEVKTRTWKPWDIEYWNSYGVSLNWLKFGQIYPISFIILYKNGSKKIVPAEKYAYVYVEFKDNHTTFKIYQPFSKDYKWLNKHDSSVWDLWSQLPKNGDKLIITSSRKDALCIWENTGIPSCSLQGEGYLPKKKVLDQLKSRFKTIYVLYDNDFQSNENHGRTFGKNMANAFELRQIEIPSEYRSKDTSDLCKNHGRVIVKEVITSLISKKN